jgi:hypothetical protein
MKRQDRADRDLDLRSIAKDRSHQLRIPPPVKNRYDPKRLLVWWIGDEVLVVRDMESQRSSGQAGTSASDMWCCGQVAEDGVDVCQYSVGSVEVVLRDVLTNFIETCERSGTESVAAHPPERRRWLFSRSFLNAS